MKLLNIAEFKEIKFTYTETETEKYNITTDLTNLNYVLELDLNYIFLYGSASLKSGCRSFTDPLQILYRSFTDPLQILYRSLHLNQTK